VSSGARRPTPRGSSSPSGDTMTACGGWARRTGSVLSFHVSTRCGLRPEARQIRDTDDCDRPVSLAIDRVDQCVSCPGPFSVRTRVTTTSTWSSVIFRGAPGRGAPVRPSVLRAGQHDPRPQGQRLRRRPLADQSLQRRALRIGQQQRGKPRARHSPSGYRRRACFTASAGSNHYGMRCASWGRAFYEARGAT
jgi:hypothetical protein